jgi:hypothetical protein
VFHTKDKQTEEEFDLEFKHRSVGEILTDRKLAALGDAYVNLIYSLALSRRTGFPEGTRVQGWVLAEALKRASLRNFLPARTDRHKQANGAEALIVYVWIRGYMTLKDAVDILSQHEEPDDAFYRLIVTTKKILLSSEADKFSNTL